MQHLGLLLLVTTLALPLAGQESGVKGKPVVSWKKTVVDRAFHSEGVAVADVNKDGKPDIIVGDVWYEAPDWKMHVLRRDPAEGKDSKVKKDPKYNPKGYNPLVYSHCFAVFADDFNGDGWPDVIVLPFPGDPCMWYENPGKRNVKYWQGHVLSQSACNETPQYADLFGTGKRVLIMGVQPTGQDNMGQMFWLRPGKDPTQLWEHHPISAPSQKGKIIPGTFRFAHGLGVGDVNRDGRADVICTAGWWQQPEQVTGQPWKFHPADLGPDCADMHAFDVDGDGKNDVITSSAHQIGLWWHQQNPGKTDPVFVRREMLLGGPVAAGPKNYLLTSEEKKLLDLVNNYRAARGLAPVRAVPRLCRAARASLVARAAKELKELAGDLKGNALAVFCNNSQDSAESVFTMWPNSKDEKFLGQWQEAGVAFVTGKDGTAAAVVLGNAATPPGNGIVVWEGMKKQLVSQTHALHLVDINGDGLKDLVTGRRWWAHGPAGDALPTEPAYLFWFEARKGPDGIVTFIPHLIDDDSGIGTQFAVADINGDGLPDIVISNKKGVFIFEQVRGPAPELSPPRKD